MAHDLTFDKASYRQDFDNVGILEDAVVRPKEKRERRERSTIDKASEDSLESVGNNFDYRIHNADCLNKKALPANCCDLIVTSPPYNVGMAYDGSEEGDAIDYEDYLKFTKKWLRNAYYWTRDTGRICVNVSIDKNKNGKQPLSAQVTQLAMEVGWKYHATIVWNEGNISRRTAWGSWMSASAPHVIAPVETVIVLYKNNWKRERQGRNDISAEEFKDWVFGVWTFNGESAKRVGHEAPFPRELPKRCIKLFSFVGDTVLDPFAGSGTTILEAVVNGRQGIGLEIENKYCELAERRVKEWTAKLLV